MTTAAWTRPQPQVLDLWAAARAQIPDTWVCCDPMCGGVELGEFVLELNHGCCDPQQLGWHRVGLGRRTFTGAFHGPYTVHWRPEREAA